MMRNRTGLVLLTVIAFAMPVIGVFSSKAMTPLLAVMSLAVLLCHPDRRSLLQPHSFPGRALPALAFLVWAGLSVIWAVSADRSLHVLGGTAVLFIGAVICLTGIPRLSGDNRQQFLAALAAGLLVAVLAVGFLAFGIFQLLHGEILDAVGPLLVAVLGGVAVFILSDVKRDIRTQRTARRVALAIVPFALLANLIQLVP